MGALFVYIVKSSACLALFYLFYRLLLSRDTFHRFNRIGLLGLVVLSVIIPFCRITIEEPIVMQPAVMDLETLLLMASLMSKATVAAIPSWVQLLLWGYLCGLLFFLCQFLYSCGNTIGMIRRGTVTRLDNHFRLVVTSEATAPFSWMRYILVSPKDMEESGQEILTHERAHIRLHHSMDLLIAEVCILFHWFNPAAWLLKQELQHIHEYEADEHVLSAGIDAKKYQLLLIKKAVGTQRFTSMANSLNHSSLKKRITMMLKRKSNPWARMKYLCVLPLAALAVVSFARPEIMGKLDRISSVKFSEMVPVKEIQGVKNVEKPVVAADSIRIASPVVVSLGDMKVADSMLQALGPIVLDFNVNPDDFQISADAFAELSDMDFAVDFSDFRLDSLNHFNIDLSDMHVNLENMQIDTAEMRKLMQDVQVNMQINKDEWIAHQKEWQKNQQEVMKQVQAAMKDQKLSKEQKQAFKEQMKEAQKQIAALDKEKMAVIQKEAAKAMKEQQVAIAKQQAVIQKEAAKQQKEAMSARELVKGLPEDIYCMIDGKEATTAQLEALPSDKIESVSILKDRSAVQIYGEKAKNGVIIVTTKK